MIALEVAVESWPLKEPFEIAGRTYTVQDVIVVTASDDAGRAGRGEASGVDHDGETIERMLAQLQALGPRLALDTDALLAALPELLPAGGARNALDCALWDLRARQSGVPAWRAAGFDGVAPCLSACTIGLGSEEQLRRRAREARAFPLVKVKLDAQRHLDVVRLVREEHPRARLVVDANGSWSAALLERLLPPLAELGVELVEQPLPEAEQAALDGLQPAVPLAADESCRDRRSLPALRGRYQFVNIKLDKCGGLSEGLALAREAQAMGFGLMVGNMCGTSLAMAPSFLLAQHCAYVDLDGPLLLARDRAHPMRFSSALLQAPSSRLWG